MPIREDGDQILVRVLVLALPLLIGILSGCLDDAPPATRPSVTGSPGSTPVNGTDPPIRIVVPDLRADERAEYERPSGGSVVFDVREEEGSVRLDFTEVQTEATWTGHVLFDGANRQILEVFVESSDDGRVFHYHGRTAGLYRLLTNPGLEESAFAWNPAGFSLVPLLIVPFTGMTVTQTEQIVDLGEESFGISGAQGNDGNSVLVGRYTHPNLGEDRYFRLVLSGSAFPVTAQVGLSAPDEWRQRATTRSTHTNGTEPIVFGDAPIEPMSCGTPRAWNRLPIFSAAAVGFSTGHVLDALRSSADYEAYFAGHPDATLVSALIKRSMWGGVHKETKWLFEWANITKEYKPITYYSALGSFDPATGEVSMTDEATRNDWGQIHFPAPDEMVDLDPMVFDAERASPSGEVDIAMDSVGILAHHGGMRIAFRASPNTTYEDFGVDPPEQGLQAERAYHPSNGCLLLASTY